MKKLIKNIQKLNDEQLITINPGLNIREFEIIDSKDKLREEYNVSKEEFVLLSVGRHVPRKKFDTVIKAIGEIKKKRPDIKLKYFLIGEGEETPKLKELAKKLNLEDIIKFLGSLDHKIKIRYYKLSDLFVMTSSVEKHSIEGFGIVFLEANAVGNPVIGGRAGGAVDAIIDGETGLLVNPQDPNDIAEKICWLFENKQEAERMGQQGRKRTLLEFSWSIIANRFEEAVHNLYYKKSWK